MEPVVTNNSIISIFDKNLDTSLSTMTFDISNIDTYIEQKEKNFYRVKHDLSNIKHLSEINNPIKTIPIVTNKNQKEFSYNTGCAGLSWYPGYPPTNDIDKSFTFTFSSEENFNINFGIPSFDIYDIPPGINILDYVPVVDGGCEYFDADKTIFPGVPCALPEIAICTKRPTIKVFGRRIRLPPISYPCGYKQKVIGSIGLEKDDTKSQVLYSSPSANFKCSGSFRLHGKVTVELYSNIPTSLFTDIVKKFDPKTFNKISNNGVNIFADSNEVIKKLYSVVTDLDWFLKLAKFSFDLYQGSVFMMVVMSSVLISYKMNIKNISINYGKNKFEMNNLYYEEKDYEIMQNGRYISFGLESTKELSIIFSLGNFKVGQLENFSNSPSPTTDNTFSILMLIQKMILNEIIDIDAVENATTKMGLRKKDLQLAADFLLKLIDITEETPGLNVFFKSIDITFQVSLKLCLTPQLPVPYAYICGYVTFTLADFIELIKEEITTIAVETLSLTTYASIDIDFIENKISPIKLPSQIKDQVNKINDKIQYANNLYIGYVENSIAKAFSYLDKINTPVEFSPWIGWCAPFFV